MVGNSEIAAVFEEIADLLELQDENPFKIRAYRKAAQVLRGLGTEAADLLTAGQDLRQLPGIGKELAAKIADIVRTGTTSTLERLRTSLPAALREMLRLPGLGPKRVRALYGELGLATREELLQAAAQGRIRALPGFGETLERQILEALTRDSAAPGRTPLGEARPQVEALLSFLRAQPGVRRVEAAGSYRRQRETVGDIDLVAAAGSGSPVIERFVSWGDVREVRSRGETKAGVVLRSGLPVDLRRVEDSSFGAALQYFTGSQTHNIALRRIARRRGLKVNEYGVFRSGARIAGRTEASVYRALGLAFIPPELREDRGEIEAAREGRLPVLVSAADLRGDLHAHTTATDGTASLEEMAQAARRRGLEYLAITDHSRRLRVAGGLDERRLLEQIEAIDRLNERWKDFTLLKGIEVEILEDGGLDLPDEVLGRLDLVIGAVHSGFRLSRERQTARILRAMDGRYFTILAHPTGRLLPGREPYALDLAAVIAKAAERGCFLELNAHPRRLDLADTSCREARAAGVRIAVNSDAHAPSDFEHLAYGIGQARRGWLEKKDVLNALPLADLLPLLRRTMAA